jgi:hypothetical protein
LSVGFNHRLGRQSFAAQNVIQAFFQGWVGWDSNPQPTPKAFGAALRHLLQRVNRKFGILFSLQCESNGPRFCGIIHSSRNHDLKFGAEPPRGMIATTTMFRQAPLWIFSRTDMIPVLRTTQNIKSSGWLPRVLAAGKALSERVGSSMVEQRPFKALVVGSSPTQPTPRQRRLGFLGLLPLKLTSRAGLTSAALRTAIVDLHQTDAGATI